MHLDYPLLAALTAVVRTGSFEKAGAALHITASAVSQRVKLLEDRLGAVLVLRGQPCVATPVGERLIRHADAVDLLEAALGSDLRGLVPTDRPATLRIAIPADSLATFFIDAMARVNGVLFDLVLDDQDHSADWLRRGEVAAAVTAQARPIQGCDRRNLGALRYVATASPAFRDRWFAGGLTADSLANAPCLTFNAKDALQRNWVESVLGTAPVLPTHWLPASQAFIDATLAGVGWGMNPECLVRDHIAAGRLVALVPDRPLDVPLAWQWSRLIGDALAPVTAAVRAAAADWLQSP